MSLLDQILELERTVWQYVIDKDREAFSRVFANDYIEVTADGQRVLKDSIVENSPVVDEIESYAITSPTIVEPSSGSAILSYQLTLIGTLRGEPISPATRWVASIWRQTDGPMDGPTEAGWQCCFFQQTGVPGGLGPD